MRVRATYAHRLPPGGIEYVLTHSPDRAPHPGEGWTTGSVAIGLRALPPSGYTALVHLDKHKTTQLQRTQEGLAAASATLLDTVRSAGRRRVAQRAQLNDARAAFVRVVGRGSPATHHRTGAASTPVLVAPGVRADGRRPRERAYANGAPGTRRTRNRHCTASRTERGPSWLGSDRR